MRDNVETPRYAQVSQDKGDITDWPLPSVPGLPLRLLLSLKARFVDDLSGVCLQMRMDSDIND